MTALPEHYRRLDAFLGRLRNDIYPEPESVGHTAITQRQIARLQELYSPPAGARVLDIGCGQGVALEAFRAAGLDAVGITLGEDARVCREKGLAVVEMDLTFLDFPDRSFDVVWCRHALEHSVMPFFTLAEIRRVLRPGGVAYIEVPAAETPCAHERNPNHYSILSHAMWMQLMLRVGFSPVRHNKIQLDVPAGRDTYWTFFCEVPAGG